MTKTFAVLAVLLASAPLRAAAPADPVLPYTPGLDTTAMDRSVDPCEDFYLYSCGGWKKNNPIPADQTAWDVYGKLAQDNRAFLRGILEQAASEEKRDPVTAEIGDYYAACMDEAGADEKGAAPLRPRLEAISALKSARGLAPLLARLQRESDDDSFLFATASQQDPDDSEKVIASLDQGGLGLPDRDYYFKDDAKSKEIRARYALHVEKVLGLLGDSPKAAKKGAAAVVRLETALAGASLTKVERRDPYQLKHKMTEKELAALAPALDWRAFLSGVKSPSFEPVNVAAPKFFARASALLKSEPLADWKAYLRFHAANADASFLSAPFVNEDFDFYRKYLKGAKEIQPRWKRCVRLVDGQLGEALGQAFVRKVFTPETKAGTLGMVAGIEKAMERRLQALDWMSPETKKQALKKLAGIRNKIGYPDKWRDYSSIRLDRGDFLGNAQRASAFEFDRQLAKIGKPVDHGEWGMTPPTVNAYFDAQMNDINFPAGVLQPPLYDAKMDAAPNYGNTGGTIGHELTHGFDDEGRQYDAQGNLKDWWTKEDAAKFAARAKCVSDQYAGYEIVDGIHINSALTLGEDVADLGGEILGYAAWKDATAGETLAPVDGLTPDQRFFVGFAQWACENVRPEQARDWALTNPHSPARDRINGVVVNMPEFAKAFSCKPGAAMVKPEGKVCAVW